MAPFQCCCPWGPVGGAGAESGCGMGCAGARGACGVLATFATTDARPPEIPGTPPLPDESALSIAWICSGVSVATSAARAELAS
jgi:hypothetical protein